MSEPAPRSSDLVVELEHIDKVYSTGRVEVHALRDVSLEIQTGELLAISGPSGSGKTTLMEILGCLARPTSGRYAFRGRPVESFEPDELASLRGEEIGFVFQSFNLLPRLSALENVEMPLSYRGVSRSERRAKARDVLDRVGLAERAEHRPSELSGGERQRVAVARALVNQPSFILADEPTGNLDTQIGGEVMRLLESLHADGTTIVIVTHDADLASRCRRQIHIRDGRVVEEAG